MAEYYAGIDLGARSSWLCVVDTKGRKQLSRKVANDPAKILGLLDPFRSSLQAVVESTFNWYWLVDLFQEHGIDVKLAHPLYLKAIAYAKVKTDQVDARQLRSLLHHPHDRRVGMAMLHLIRSLDEEIVRFEERVSTAVFRRKPVILLKTIPGVGKILGATIYFEVGQIRRFASDKAFASYCRLAPTVAQSGAVSRQGRNRRQGNRWLKWAFSSATRRSASSSIDCSNGRRSASSSNRSWRTNWPWRPFTY